MFVHSGHVMTLANSIIGVGILAMPFCFQKCGIILAILLLIISNWITRICCHYLIKCSLLTRRKSFEFLGFHAFGTSGKLLVELCIIGYLLGTCITYFVVVGDLGPQIVTKMLALDSPHVHLRTWIMIAVTLVCILPLGMLKNVDSLSTVCTASIGFYVCLVLKIVLESQDHILANDWTGQVRYWEPSGVLQCLPIFSMALSCQMQLFEVFESISNQSLDKLNGIVKNATWICTFVYIAVGFFGYVAFCTQIFSGNILINLSESFGSDVIKIGFVLSVAFSFPLVIFPCRASIYSLLYRKGHTDASGYIPETRFKVITIVIVALALTIALMIPSVELVIGLVGSTIGVAICIMFPACCFRKIVKKESTERSLAQFILISGFCLMILGTYANLNAIDVQRSGAHLEVPASVEEVLTLPSELSENNLKSAEKEVIVNNLSQAEQIAEMQLMVPESIKIPEKPKEPRSKAKPSPPPLPVDEKHDIDSIITADAKELPLANVIAKEEEPVKVAAVDIELAPLASNQTESGDLTKNNVSLNSVITTQGINKDAINKDEEIAAEELKNDKMVKISDSDELKKTQNELKETKELLQRTVGELKQELAKQNQKTQNFVAKKLEQVVEKVEKIEREVHKKEEEGKNEVIEKEEAKEGEETKEKEVAKENEEPKEKEVAREKDEPKEIGEAKKQAKENDLEKKKYNKDKVEPLRKEAEIKKPLENVLQSESEVKGGRSGAELTDLKAASKELKEKDRKLVSSPDLKRRNKGSLISILAEENAKEKINEEKQQAKPKVYEPLSYKTGELIENVRNASILEQRLRLPLPLLINASTSHDNVNKESIKAEAKQPILKPKSKENRNKLIKQLKNYERENNLKPAQSIVNSKVNTQLDQKEVAKKQQKINESEIEKENIEAIRRDLLQLKSFQLDDSAAIEQGQQQKQRERVKRSSQHEHNQLNLNINDLNQQLEQKNCLSSVNVLEKMLTMNVGNFNTGRQLKASEVEESNQ